MKMLTDKQIKALNFVQKFDPLKSWDAVPYSSYIITVPEDKNGVSPEEAYFMFTERGKYPTSVTNLKSLNRLLSCHRWMTAHQKMYKQARKEGTILRTDFLDDKELEEFAFK